MARNIETREGYEFWDRLNKIPKYGFLLSPAGNSVQKTKDIGDWIDRHEAQVVMDDAQSEVNELREQKEALESEAQALREEVAALRARVVVIPAPRDVDSSSDPEYRASATGYNVACADTARLNGKAVSEGLLRRVTIQPPAVCDIEDQWKWQREHDHALDELRALLGEGKE